MDTWADSDSACLHLPALTQALLKVCPYNCKWLYIAYSLFQLTHMSRDDHAVQIEQAIAEDKR